MASAPSDVSPDRQPSGSGKLINIDNGGTLTDICVSDGERIYRTKSVTTPFDLSKCVFEGLSKVSRLIYGREDLAALLASTDHIRYSTTQGTNALVERKGPRLGLILGGAITQADVRGREERHGLFDALVAERFAVLDLQLADAELDAAAVRIVNQIASAGASRIVVAFGGADFAVHEQRLKRLLLRRFPSHLLGAVPVLYSHEMIEDGNDVRRTWTALFNAFLHPAMERFLYRAEHGMRESRSRHPLLIFRNDGCSARVARTTAIKTYSSGPRGGMEGARALAAHYGFDRLLTMDVGGTTTDIGLVDKGIVRADQYGKVEGVETSYPLCDVVSVGVGGSSIISVVDGEICVGPQSVGSTPGPACFGLGGREATITDAFLLQGLLDPASFFGGEMKIDVERARAVVQERVAGPLRLDLASAVAAMEAAWVAKIADGLRKYTEISPDMVLAAFGGGGPFVACKIAEAIGVRRVIIPGLAAVFSAFGIGFSDIGHTYEVSLPESTQQQLTAALEELKSRARRGMFAEGFKLEECQLDTTLIVRADNKESRRALKGTTLPTDLDRNAHIRVSLNVVRPIRHMQLAGRFGSGTTAALSKASRTVRLGNESRPLPLYRIEDQQGGVAAEGPAVLEEAFFTCRLDRHWRFEMNLSGDILLTRDALRAARPSV